MTFKVQDHMCSSCIYRPDSPLDLGGLEHDAQQQDSWRICHHSDDVCCRGFWDRHKNGFNMGRIAQRLNMVEFVDVDTSAST